MALAEQILPLAQAKADLNAALRRIEAGIPLEEINRFAASSRLSVSQICSVVIPPRTLKHRRDRKERLTLDESDKFERLVRIYSQTVAVFANTDKALWWLNEPQYALKGFTPLRAAQTETGGRMVEEILIQIDEGIFP